MRRQLPALGRQVQHHGVGVVTRAPLDTRHELVVELPCFPDAGDPPRCPTREVPWQLECMLVATGAFDDVHEIVLTDNDRTPHVPEAAAGPPPATHLVEALADSV